MDTTTTAFPDLSSGIEMIRDAVQHQLDIFNAEYITPSKQVIEKFTADFRRLEQEKLKLEDDYRHLEQYNSLLNDKLRQQEEDMKSFSNVSMIKQWEKKIQCIKDEHARLQKRFDVTAAKLEAEEKHNYHQLRWL